MTQNKKMVEALAIGIVFAFVLALFGSWLWSMNEKWLEAEKVAEAARLVQERKEAEIAQKVVTAQKTADEIAQEKETFLQWKKGVIRDPWGQEFTVEESNGVWSGITVTSFGPDGQKDTDDDIKGHKSKGIDAVKIGESVGNGVGRFGIGTVKGLYKAAKDQLVSEEKPDDAPRPSEKGSTK